MLPPWEEREKWQGLSDAELDMWEKKTGLPLPQLYREHMKQQNGGYFHYNSFLDEEKQLHPLFVNNDGLSCLNAHASYTPFAEVFDYMTEEKWKEVFGKEPKMERLYALSYMDGHSALVLDYGCKGGEMLQEPEVCCYDMTGAMEEVFRVESYAKFIEGLVYDENEWFLGLKTNLDMEALARLLEKLLPGRWLNGLAPRHDDQQGWYNFDTWYSGYLEWIANKNGSTQKNRLLGLLRVLMKGRKRENYSDGRIVLNLIPNQNRSGTYYFEDDKDCQFILVINPRFWNRYGSCELAKSDIDNLLHKLQASSITEGLEVRFILPGE